MAMAMPGSEKCLLIDIPCLRRAFKLEILEACVLVLLNPNLQEAEKAE